MSPLSVPFWLVIGALMVWTRLPFVGRRLRGLGFVVGTFAMFLPGGGLGAWLALVGVAAYGWLALGVGRGRLVLGVHLTVVTALLGVSHLLAPSPGEDGWWPIVPLLGFVHMYMRLVHILIEVEQGRVAKPDPLAYLAWMVPVLQLAPFQRFPEFLRQLEAPVPPIDRELVLAALDRITDGVVKRLVIGVLLARYVGFDLDGTGWWLLLQINLAVIWVYLAFSGLQDVLIGVGMLMGWRPPESFFEPLRSRNMVEFWRRWNVPMGDFFRDYCFVPLNLTLQRTSLGAHPLRAGAICYVVTMVCCGLWHSIDIRFALWGLVQGGALIVCKQYETSLKQLLGRARFKHYVASRWTAVPATVLTFQFVAFSLMLSHHPLDKVLDVLGRLW